MTKIYKKEAFKRRASIGEFLDKTLIKDGDLVEVANEGTEQEGDYGTQNIFLIKLEDGKEGNVSFNKTTMANMIDAFGENATNWIGQKVKAVVVKQMIDNRLKSVHYFCHPDAILTEEGAFVLEGKDPKSKDDGIPVIEEDDDIDAEEVAK